MKKHLLLMAGGAAILGSVGWFATRHAEHVMLETSIDHFRQALGPDATFTFATAKPGILGRSVNFTNLTLRQGPETITADRAELERPGQSGGDITQIGRLSFHGFQLTDPAISLQSDQLDIEDLTLPVRADSPGDPAQPLGIGHAHAVRLRAFVSPVQTDMAASDVTLDNFGEGLASRLEAHDLALNTDSPPDMGADGGQRHLHALDINVDGMDLSGFYTSLSTGAPYLPRPGVHDITVTNLDVTTTAPVVRAARILAHTNRTDSKEQDVVSIRGLELWPDAPNLGWLPTLGYTHFVGGLVLNETRDLQTNTLHVEELALDAPNMGRLHLNGTFIRPGSAPLLSAPRPDMPVIAMDLSYLDHGMVPRALQAIAEARGMSPAMLLNTLATQQPSTPEGRAIVAFLAHPGQKPLHLVLQPPQPQPLAAVLTGLATLGAIPQINQQMGLHVKTP
ncbi:hypothetical protein [Acetobacter peroxydans]|uniref:hypothetical protein n=2 Tax=Acetobacter peroxydans TaxID=104098 RepID=UPI002357E2BF|nr:hypothetical protein [Acetobacter peroxydans]MCH4143403.1 hypothetical protein [Acetobacter peroxydans]MCI1394168.1 hypothetical protein [Acetobacter peroxydans]MCI1411463.1 hypothetical protein [Acetobacter peroxydans]MCI1618777.1 hypothetical protein [Acetobacter peroxydans]MCI1725101.1 hypothetical protein [Acetobacter peroxydans]